MLDGLRPGSARFGEPGQVTFDYFASELFGRLPVETQAILLDTCLAPWVNAEMASALTGNARAPHLLEELWRKHLFVYRRAEPISSYQYHPLFREFLQNQLHAVRGAAALVTAKRCAQLLAQVGAHDAAIDLFLRANGPDQAVQIVLSQPRTLVGQDRPTTLDASIGRLAATLEHWLRRSKARMRNGNVNQAVPAALAALNYLECLGVSAELRDLVERVRPLIDQPVLSPILLCRWLANEAVSEILFLDDEAQGFAQLARSLDIAHKNGLHALMPYLHLTYTLAHLFIGDFAGAQRRIGAFTSTLGCMGGPIDCLRGAIAIQAGRVEEGVDLVRRGHPQMDVSATWLIRLLPSLYLSL